MKIILIIITIFMVIAHANADDPIKIQLYTTWQYNANDEIDYANSLKIHSVIEVSPLRDNHAYAKFEIKNSIDSYCYGTSDKDMLVDCKFKYNNDSWGNLKVYKPDVKEKCDTSKNIGFFKKACIISNLKANTNCYCVKFKTGNGPGEEVGTGGNS